MQLTNASSEERQNRESLDAIEEQQKVERTRRKERVPTKLSYAAQFPSDEELKKVSQHMRSTFFVDCQSSRKYVKNRNYKCSHLNLHE